MKRQVSINLPLKISLALLMIFISAVGCKKSAYDQLVRTEMEKNIIHDSLVFGLKFGQTRKEFFARCWELNKKGLISEGPQNKFVRYRLPKKGDSISKSDVTMLFYGSFNDQNIMTAMDFQFYHESWSLWNKSLQSNQLKNSIKDSLLKWYPGNDFIKIGNDSTEILVKVDGNRRIIIKPVDDFQLVKAKIDDLRYVLND